MEIIATIAELKAHLTQLKIAKNTIALVPTMGALHQGHLSLIKIAQTQSDVVVCSIFVNPTQFTNQKDLKKYPRPLAHDIKMLQDAGCNVVFMPLVTEMYPKQEQWHINLGPSEFLLEGEFRKGHYQGVTQIVKKLFDAVMPDLAFFGQKDYQQVLMIKQMVKYFKLKLKIISCPIIREKDGLAMSSRNIHLTENDRENALVLNKALQFVLNNFKTLTLTDLLSQAKKMINATNGVKLEYFTLANGDTLLPIKNKNCKNIVALVAANVGQTRLIDNMLLPSV